MVASAEAHVCATGGLQTWKAMRDGNAHNCLGDSVPVVVNSSGNPGVLCLRLVQKAASTTFKELVLKALHVGGFPDPDGHFRADPHHPPRHLPVVGASPTWQRLLEERPNAPRFMIVRHPHSRLLSGYLDNVLSNEDRAKWPRGFESRDQGFTAFVRAVVEDDQLNPHFELQTKHCEAAHVDYEILRLEEQRVWFGRFACALGLQDAASSGWAADSGPFWRGTAECFDSACGCESFVCEREREGPGCAAATSGGDATVHVTGASHLLQEYYTDQIAELVNTWARPDLERFGYRPFVPSEQHRELFWVPPQPPPPRTSPTMPVPPPTLSSRPLLGPPPQSSSPPPQWSPPAPPIPTTSLTPPTPLPGLLSASGPALLIVAIFFVLLAFGVRRRFAASRRTSSVYGRVVGVPTEDSPRPAQGEGEEMYRL